MHRETQALLCLAEGVRRGRIAGLPGYRFQLNGSFCALVECGMGFIRSERAARALIAALEPRCVVSCGIAGAAAADMRVGDVIVAAEACFLEGRSCRERTPLIVPSKAFLRTAEAELSACGARLFVGTAVTTGGSQIIEDAPPWPVLEMETIGIARVCAEYGVPLLSVRGVSDGPTEPTPIPIEELVDSRFNLRIAHIVRAILRRPTLIPRFLQFDGNCVKAARNAAIVVRAILAEMAAADYYGESGAPK